MRSLFIFISTTLIVNCTVRLTFSGNNRNPSISPDGRYVVYEGSGGDYGHSCPQIYQIDLYHLSHGSSRLSTGIASASNVNHMSQNKLVYSSNMHHFLPLGNDSVISTCRPNICQRKTQSHFLRKLCKSRNLQELDPSMDLFQVNWLGNIEKQLTQGLYCNMEVSGPFEGTLLYTSVESGDPEVWKIDVNTLERKKMTEHIGYDGEASFSPNGNMIVFTSTEVKSYRSYAKLLHHNLVDKSKTELFIMNADGTNRTQLTHLRGTIRHPKFIDETTIIFSSSHRNQSTCQIYTINIENGEITQITFTESNDSPMLSENGKKIVWASVGDHHWNIYVSDINWKTRIINLDENSTNESFHGLDNPAERHLSSVNQLTFGGQNAEGYFDFESKNILFQATGVERYGTSCDQIYKLNIEGKVTPSSILQRISTGLGACTCSYFFPDDQTYIYASTFASVKPEHLENSCPIKKCQSREALIDPVLKKLCNTSYTWDLFPEYDIYKVNKYGNIIKRLTDITGYDAEGAVSADGKTIVFTSLRTGDPELWLMNADGGNLRQLTDHLGYDGGPFFSPDGSKVVFRASRPTTDEEIKKYKQLLSYNLVEPLAMELFEINIDGTGIKQITHLGGSNWAPFFLVDNYRILYSTNFNQTGRFGAFDIYMVNEKGEGVERITYNEGGFDAFPMQSRDGSKVIWGSSRNAKSPYDLNLFIADWTD